MECTTFTNAASRPRLRDVIGQAALIFARAGSESPRLDAEVLLAHALALTREQLILMADLPLGAEQTERFESFLARRLNREPVAYIIGQQEFWSLDFRVTRDVLIPRPETERLIEVVLQLAAQLSSNQPLRVLDIGTGSGAIAVSVAKELPSARIYATDISPSALAIARQNAELNGVDARITFRYGDLFAPLTDQIASFDMIVSNPPYIRRAEIVTLTPEVCRWEPRTALDGGADGLDFYRRIAAQAGRFLAPNGAIALEIGANMGAEVLPILMQAGFNRDVNIVRDYAERDRVAVARVATDAT
ncbi:MAG TPA: peptide chain release factor N(5)-glutamine methyltransferase [Candidatus Limnocylindrales bacterium]|nr:peptide chain release factor N(5)-glutamine methyltransferase [Candidatus Limnocylindrales bacterium]